MQISYETKLQAILHFLLHYFVYLTTFSARIQDGWWQQDTCFAWSRIKIYCWSWAFCSCIIFLLFLFCTVSNCHGPWAIILYAIPIQFAKYAQVHYKVYSDRHIFIDLFQILSDRLHKVNSSCYWHLSHVQSYFGLHPMTDHYANYPFSVIIINAIGLT